ncbi:MAG: formylglycine-generating enzyme family protein [Lysobacterales bacterium]|nr:formylglycine-generating enzyme family protein [Rhodanobacteraceae bacterium]
MASDRQSRLSFVIALAIILGSAWIGWWREQREDAPTPGGVNAPMLAQQEPYEESPDPTEMEPDEALDDSATAAVEGAEPAEESPPVDVSAEELAALIAAMRSEIKEGRLLEPIDSSAFAQASRILVVDPANEEAREVLQKALTELRDASSPVVPDDLLKTAEKALTLLPEGVAEDAVAVALRASVDTTRKMRNLIARAERLSAREGAGPKTFASAAEAFRGALAIDSANARALRGMEDLQRRMIERALASAYDLRFITAGKLLDQAEELQTGTSRVLDARSQVMAFRAQAEAENLTRFKDALASADLEQAESALAVLRKLLTDDNQVRDLESKVVNVRLYGGFAPGERFGDSLANGGRGPRMVVVPVGRFVMGSAESEEGSSNSERPQRRIEFTRGFAIARNEITVSDFRDFVQAAGYTTDAERSGSSAIYDEKTGRMTKSRRANWQRSYNGSRARDNDPVVHVSWNDARAYAEWLKAQTSKPYRLPTEAEFEYVLRAGTRTAYPWGDGDPPRVLANVAGAGELSKEGRRWNQGFVGYDDKFWGVAPVRSFEPNAYRLYDLDGNVSEWVEDCWHDNYLRAPDQPVAWVNPGCELRVIRGGSWGSSRDQVRSAWRGSALADSSGARVGFRVVREL